MSPSKSGFALTEVLVALFVLGVSTVAVTGLAVLSTRTSFDAERQTVALAIANEKVEHVRSLPYEDVGYKDARGLEADGVLDRRHDVQRNQQKYTVDTRIELVDDPANGILPQISLNEATADYKRVTIQVGWQSTSNNNRNVSVVSLVSKGPGTTTCTPGDPKGCPGTESPGEDACVPREPCPDSGVCSAPKPKPYCPPGAQYCQQCYSDKDCEAGNACNTDTRACEPKEGACKTSADCSGGQVCSSGQCTASCVSAGCEDGNICNPNTGVCAVSCNGDACDCPPGLECNKDKGLCEEKKPECSDGVDNTDPEDALADTADPGCHEDEELKKPFVPDDNDETDGGLGGEVPGPPPPAPPPGGPCSSDSQCPSGMTCSNGACQGGQCENPLGPKVDCSLLPPVDTDPTCSSINSCRLQGRFAITGYIPRISDDYDPSCNVGVVTFCEPIRAWLPCPPCPRYPAQCEDGFDNDNDGKIDFPADKGCISRKDHSEADIPQCADGKDNNNDKGRRIDEADPGCHTDYNVANKASYDKKRAEGFTQCTDLNDNDQDQKIDAADPGCHLNDNATLAYVPADDDEIDVPVTCKKTDLQDLGSAVNQYVKRGQTTFGYCDTQHQFCDLKQLPDRQYTWQAPYNGNFSFIVEIVGRDDRTPKENSTLTFHLQSSGITPSGGKCSNYVGATAGTPGTAYTPLTHLNAGVTAGLSVNARMTDDEFFRIYIIGVPDCGNNQCEPTLGENSQTCRVDCPTPNPCNNNFSCEELAGENKNNCAADCFCGNNQCEANFENSNNCPKDCPLPPLPNKCDLLKNAANLIDCGDGSKCPLLFRYDTYVCPAGATCKFSQLPAGKDVNIACGDRAEIKALCSTFGFQPAENDQPKLCIDARKDKYGPLWYKDPPNPSVSVKCIPNSTECEGKNSCTVSFSQGRCGGPNDGPYDQRNPDGSLKFPNACRPYTESFIFSCKSERPKGVIGDGICDSPPESPSTSPDCPVAKLNDQCYWTGSDSPSNCPNQDEGAQCKKYGSNPAICRIICDWRPSWWPVASCPAGYTCNAAAPLLRGYCE